ncbi:cyclase family protein [Lutimonas zeaxanthinifaciens]|uniref:cyclase family protein n=1 Tax=Lutimonas zeaxanthinifaciens TaxID=3060215 RepID=UPI00265C98B3|nr:cyclase family protein [Lutimonas sp. YSD2104]WKK66493.1 cyclase family protein [Lutimonas sp. YSD2104]
MNHEIKLYTILSFFSLGLLINPSLVFSQQWGKGDQKGATNHITPEKVVQAANLISKGKIYKLGQIYETSMPKGGRNFTLHIIGPPPIDESNKNSTVGNLEFFTGEIGQIGTQFDGLGHIGYREEKEDFYYNGFTGTEIYSSSGLRKLGVEHAGPFFTRGILIDVAGFKGVERLEAGYEITLDDIQQTLKKQNVSINEGDVVLIRTGHSRLWKVDNDAYYDWVGGEPGIGTSAGQWLADQKIVIVGSDNYGVEVVPFSNAEASWPVHLMMLKENGIHLLESLNLEELSQDQVYEFAFMFSPLPIKGATGSPGNPIAIK